MSGMATCSPLCQQQARLHVELEAAQALVAALTAQLAEAHGQLAAAQGTGMQDGGALREQLAEVQAQLLSTRQEAEYLQACPCP